MDDRHQVPENAARRRFLKQAVTVAWASPLIVTMLSRTAQAQPVQCGTQTGTGGCTVTNPCGTGVGVFCGPQPTNLGAGNPCVCRQIIIT